MVLGVLSSRFCTAMVGVRPCPSQAEMAMPSQGNMATAGLWHCCFRSPGLVPCREWLRATGGLFAVRQSRPELGPGRAQVPPESSLMTSGGKTHKRERVRGPAGSEGQWGGWASMTFENWAGPGHNYGQVGPCTSPLPFQSKIRRLLCFRLVKCHFIGERFHLGCRTVLPR